MKFKFMPRTYTEADVDVIDYTNPTDKSDISHVFVIRDSGTYLGLLAFDYRLEAFDAAQRYKQPLEIHTLTAIQ